MIAIELKDAKEDLDQTMTHYILISFSPQSVKSAFLLFTTITSYNPCDRMITMIAEHFFPAIILIVLIVAIMETSFNIMAHLRVLLQSLNGIIDLLHILYRRHITPYHKLKGKNSN